MKNLLSGLICLLFADMAIAQPEVDLELIASGFSLPLDIKNVGDDRLFVVERAGRIKILNVNGNTNTTPFLDIDAQVIAPGGPGEEGGLLGLAFHPDYSNNGFFYVNYINNSGNSVISRFTVSADPDVADVSSESIIMNVSQPFPNHNGGHLAFGPDGYLYIGFGDGGSGSDPDNNGQNLASPLGKMLRIDVDNGNPYSIPPGNPYADDGDPATLAEIWAYGLRNPWRYTFDSSNGDLWIADVGQGNKEEINKMAYTTADINYGWRCYEGSDAFNTTGCPPANSLTFPVGEYSHTGNGLFKCSITGGYVYRGSDFPNFQGVYFFADYCSNEIGTLQFNGSSWDINFNGPFGSQGFAGFGLDSVGELYIAGLETGDIYKLIDGSLNIADIFRPGFKMYPNPTDDILNIQWPSGTTTKSLRIFDVSGKQVLIVESEQEGELLQISTNSLASGLYLIELSSNQGSITKKLIIE